MNESNGKLSAGQRAMLGADAVMRNELGIADAATVFGSSPTSVQNAMNIKKKSVDVASEIRRGHITLRRGLERVGYRASKRIGSNLTVGDQWERAIRPALSYAKHWAGRPYEKVNPKEAARRLEELRELQTYLGRIETELAWRSQSATLRIGRR